MKPFETIASLTRTSCRAGLNSTRVFLSDVGHGLLEVSHNTFALLGIALTAVLVFAAGHPELRQQAELQALSWLQARHEPHEDPAELLASELSEPNAVARATASDPKALSRQQAAVAQWLSRRYNVAPEPVSRLVQEAWAVGAQARLDPTLILAVMAIESRFNPFAQSHVGAQGLMQVMTNIHNDKYEAFGGKHAAFDPVTNLRVGVQVLKECIARAGSLEAGLRFYVGAANLADDGGYAAKVLGEQSALRLVASGQTVSPYTQPISVKPETATVTESPKAEPEPSKPEQVALAP